MSDIIYLPPPGKKVNFPTEEGQRVGQLLAEAINAPTHEMCADCVFRHGSFPNGCEQTLDDAMLCLLNPKEHGAFICNHPDDGGENRVCAGYAYAMKFKLLPPSKRLQAVLWGDDPLGEKKDKP